MKGMDQGCAPCRFSAEGSREGGTVLLTEGLGRFEEAGVREVGRQALAGVLAGLDNGVPS